MKKKLLKLFTAALIAMGIMSVPVTAQAAQKSIEYLNENKTYTQFDITNDGKPDKIKIRKTLYEGVYDPAPGRYDIYVNGKNVYSVAAKYCGYGVGTLCTVSSKKHFLNLQLFHPYNDKSYSNKILYYSGGKLKVVADTYSQFLKSYTIVDSFMIKKVDSKKISLSATTIAGGIGINSCNIDYNISGSKLTQATKTFSIRNDGTNPYMRPGENIWYANRSLTAYKSVGSSSKSFTLQNGSQCKIARIYFGSNAWIKVYKGSKYGWIKCPNNDTPYFYESYFY